MTDQFEVDTTLTGDDEQSATRNVYIKKATGNSDGFKVSGWWRIRPIAGKVKCADVSGNPDVLWDSSVVTTDLGQMQSIPPTIPEYARYAFRVVVYTALSGSSPIFSEEQVNSADMSEWLVAPFEVNADGETDAQDFADMADAYDP